MTGSRYVSRRAWNVGGIVGHTATRSVGGIALATLAVLFAPDLAAASEGGGGGGLIELNRSLLVQVINFVILLGVLYRFAYKPLIATLESRSTAIKQQLAEAQAARESAQRQLVEFERRLEAAQAEAREVRERALREAAETRERLTAEARHEATRLLAEARAEIEQSVRRARHELRAEVDTLAVEIAERLIQRSLREEDHHRLVKDALARLDQR
jgi:F-type H+-transporting ATPase subunit b